ncbi:polysaccharide deacetylase family protein [Seonamhaeicola sp.]|uniref:polysaccharide deacetylase family protein n=1 Tax=Seonamhaeicola sp. TaxID=1912245 RepID=UPI00260E955D|nr:polysaccharide deacetylase family protein [Seonamhaeicola sp.]
MTLTPIKTPVVAKKIFPNYIWDIPSADKSIYLTFDDGPTPEITDWVLNTLKPFHAKATFFCIGNNVDKHPDIFQNVLKEGHRIGNHTQDHIKGWKTKAKAYLKNIYDAEQIMSYELKVINRDLKANNNSELLTLNSKLFRPPYGQLTPKQGKQLIKLGYTIVMWDVLSFDWDKNISEETCLNNVISKAGPGSIIVFHDSVKASKNMMHALPKVLDYFSKQGYTFKTIP